MVESTPGKTSDGLVRRWRKPKQARSWARVNRMLDVAEKNFMEQGYAAATTKQIAADAEVPIGSLYQFFPDKAAILQALAERYTDLFKERLRLFQSDEVLALPLPDYVVRLTQEADCFFREHPAYRAIFVEVMATMPETDEAMDDQIIQTCIEILPKLNDSLEPTEYEIIAFVLVKAIGHLHWVSSGQAPELRERLLLEIQRLAFNYLNSYFHDEGSENN
ncbi:MAG: TetR/AcrR family transcriptional regulator [Cyanophyceae cyanobacterium]